MNTCVTTLEGLAGGRNFRLGDALLPRLQDVASAVAVMSAELSSMTRAYGSLRAAFVARETRCSDVIDSGAAGAALRARLDAGDHTAALAEASALARQYKEQRNRLAEKLGLDIAEVEGDLAGVKISGQAIRDLSSTFKKGFR